MRRTMISLMALGLVGAAHCNIYTFAPSPSDLNDLDHFYYYTWGIKWSLPKNQVIVEAELKFKNIYDWIDEPNDHLYSHLLNVDPPVGVKSYYDDQGGGDNFAGKGVVIGDYNDPKGGNPRNFDLVYKFSNLGLIDDLTADLADGKFGFGFDPDCHYFNDGVSFKIKTMTAPVPEPASMLALSAGIVGLVRRRARRSS